MATKLSQITRAERPLSKFHNFVALILFLGISFHFMVVNQQKIYATSQKQGGGKCMFQAVSRSPATQSDPLQQISLTDD